MRALFILLGGRGGDGAIPPAAREDKPAPRAANLDTPAWVQHFPGADPVITKAKTAVAAKLENPASAVFDEKDRAARKNTLGQSVDSICGRVKSKRASGDENETRPFLYLVKDEEAFVVDDSSAASMAYRAICK